MELRLDLFPGQKRTAGLRCSELLLHQEPTSGASHVLRAMAIIRAWSRPNTAVVIAAADEQALQRSHIEGDSGLWRMLEPVAEAGAGRWYPARLFRFSNGSSIQVLSVDGAARRNPDVLLIDNGETLSFALFSRLRERALRGPSGDPFPRLVLATRSEEGWMREHWPETNAAGEGDRQEAWLRHEDLPSAIRATIPATPPPLSFREYIQRVMGDFAWYRHTEAMVEACQSLVDGDITRLIIQAPPRYWKSLTISRLLPAYWLHRYPWEWTAAISSDPLLALTFSKDARFFYENGGGRFRTDAQEAALWRTMRGGGMWARSMGQVALGFGFNLGVIDDPFKNWKDAQRPLVQQEVDDYFWKTFYNRRDIASSRPAAIAVMQQRLAEGDLVGRLLKREAEGKHPPEGWHLLDLPAIRRKRQTAFPRTVTVLPDWREEGEALCPEVQTVEELDVLERNDKITHAAIYQQDPLPEAGGTLFERWWWPELGDAGMIAEMLADGHTLSQMIWELQRREIIPVLQRDARCWDFAATEGKGDATASTRGGITLRRQIIYTDCTVDHVGPELVEDLIVEQAERDGRGVEVIIPQEPTAAGKILYTNLKNRLERRGFVVTITPIGGSKWVRAIPHAGAAKPDKLGNPGRCSILARECFRPWWEQHHRFDGVSKPMDLVDATSSLYAELEVSAFLGSALRA